MNQSGAWADKEVSLLIHVQRAWWQTYWFFTAVIVFVVALVAWAARIWSVRKLKGRVQRLEKEHAIERERARIARNLHDELGGSLTQIGLLAERLRRHRNMEEIEKTLGTLVRRTQGLATDLESIVWTVSPQNNSWDRLASFVSRYARLFFNGTGMECQIEGAESVPVRPLALEAQYEALAICKEALNNVLKHSKASRVIVGFCINENVFEIKIQDNGVGFEPSLKEHSERNGLTNMRVRATEIGGRLEIESHPGAGTIILLRVPLTASSGQSQSKII
jgi:signal transduction histidine kinase